MTWVSSFGLLIGRCLISALFLLAGINKIFNFDRYLQSMTEKGLPVPSFLLIGAIIFLILGSILIIIGYKSRIGALLLLLFLIPTTLLFHNFWDLSGDQAAQEQINFMKNLSLMGGLIVLLSGGPGGCSFDACSTRK